MPIRSTENSDFLHTIGFAFLLLLSVVLPFELKGPLFRVGPLGVTSVEIGIYLVIVVWILGQLAGKCRVWTAAHTAVAVWAALLILSALLASSFRPEALKFALRSIGGCVLCFAAAEFVRTPRSAVLVGFALLGGAILSAAAAPAEVWLPGAAKFLENFKTGPSLTGSYLRASATFQYANIASMYWEAMLPLALTVAAWWGRREFRKRWWWAGFVCALLLVEAIVLAASRAGILVAALTLTAIMFVSRGAKDFLRPLAGASLLSLLLLIIIQMASNNLLLLRLTTKDASSWYRAEFDNYPAQLTLKAGEIIQVPLLLRNRGRVTWRAAGRQSVAVSYHWLDPAAENILIWRGARSVLPSDVRPGNTVSLNPWIIAPAKPGRYTLQWDMLQEEIAWFSVFGNGHGYIRVEVLPSAVVQPSPDFPAPVSLPLPSTPGRVDLWRAASRMWLQHPLLGVGPDNFRRLYGSYVGPKSFDDRTYANNQFLEMLATVGLAGTAAFVAVLIAVALKIRWIWLGASREEFRLLGIGMGAAVAALCVHGLVDCFLPFTSTYGLFWILAGTAVGLGHAGDSR